MSEPDEPRTPSLEELLRAAGRALLRGMHVTLPARVERYDATNQCVDAQPFIKQERIGEGGTKIVERAPVVTRCPVVFQGSGPYRDTFPIAVGSVVILHFTSASMDRWLAIGGEVAPEDRRSLSGDDAFAVPGGHSYGGSTAPSTTAPTDARVLHGPAIKLGGPAATSAVALVSDLAALRSAVQAVPMAGSLGDAAALKAAIVEWLSPGSSTTKAL